MAPPVAVYVFAAVLGVAAAFAFKEFVYEPHLAPHIEAWAEDFLERRRAARNRRASAVPVRTSRRRGASLSSDSSDHDDDHPREGDGINGDPVPNGLEMDGVELEALVSREVDEWRNEVLRSQERTRVGLRRRRTGHFRDELDSMSTTLDESFTSLTHTPLASTHVISNLSSPITPSTASLPLTPKSRPRSDSQSTTTHRDGNTTVMGSQSPSVPMPEMTPRMGSPGLIPRHLLDGVDHPDVASPSPLSIPDVALLPLSLTPTSEGTADDSPFGPLLPDTPRSSAEIYGTRPFSPITRGMGSTSSFVSSGSRGTLPSRVNSTGSPRTLHSSIARRGSDLSKEVVVDDADGRTDQVAHLGSSTSTFRQANVNGSVISSLSERYPAPPTPPVIVSPPTSSIGVLSPPTSPGSGGSGVMVNHDGLATAPHSPSHPLSAMRSPPGHASLPVLQLPVDRSRLAPNASSRTAVSPALSHSSEFLSPMPISRTASESEGDEFLSVASDDSEWSISPATPAGEPVHDRANNPFLDFEHLSRRGGRSDHTDGSEGDGSEVIVSDPGHEGASEVGSDESWGDIGR